MDMGWKREERKKERHKKERREGGRKDSQWGRNVAE